MYGGAILWCSNLYGVVIIFGGALDGMFYDGLLGLGVVFDYRPKFALEHLLVSEVLLFALSLVILCFYFDVV